MSLTKELDEKAVGNLVAQDPGAAAEAIEQMEDGPGQRQAKVAFFQAWFEKPENQPAALQWLTDLPDQQMRRQAVKSVETRWASKDPKGFRDFIAGPMGTLVSPFMVEHAASRLAREDPVAAMAWAAQLPGGREKLAIEPAMKSWLGAKTEPVVD